MNVWYRTLLNFLLQSSLLFVEDLVELVHLGHLLCRFASLLDVRLGLIDVLIKASSFLSDALKLNRLCFHTHYKASQGIELGLCLGIVKVLILAFFVYGVVNGLSDLSLDRTTCRTRCGFLFFFLLVHGQVEVVQGLLGHFLQISVATGLVLRHIRSDASCLEHFRSALTMLAEHRLLAALGFK